MTKPEEVQCDHCDVVFKIRLIEKPHPGKVIETYFKCPACDEKYITHVTDDWARQEQRRIKRLNDELIKRKGQLQVHIDKLKIKVQGTR